MPPNPSNAPEVLAEIWTSNLAIKAKVDAAVWLARASTEEIRQVAAAGWSGAGSETPVVRFFAALDDDARGVVDYARRAAMEVLFAIDRSAALAWMDAYRIPAAPRRAETRGHTGGTSAPRRTVLGESGEPTSALLARGSGRARRGASRFESDSVPAREKRSAWLLTH
jgi:hypothetical protein